MHLASNSEGMAGAAKGVASIADTFATLRIGPTLAELAAWALPIGATSAVVADASNAVNNALIQGAKALDAYGRSIETAAQNYEGAERVAKELLSGDCAPADPFPGTAQPQIPLAPNPSKS